MRERTTWNRDAVRTAAMNRTADPYTMNQDHVEQQPAADAYVTGTPSDFAEDVTPTNRWEEEYKGGQVDRNEIGMPEMRGETFKHPEKTAAVLLKKAELCSTVAAMMLGKSATESAIENHAYGLMYMPDTDLIQTFDRLASDGQVPTAQVQEQAPVVAQQQAPVAQQQQQTQLAQALQANDAQGIQAAVQQMIQQAVQQQQACKMAAEEQKPAEEPKEEPKEQQAKQAEQQPVNIEAMVSQMVQQAMQQQAQQQAPAPAPQQGGQQAAQQQQAQQEQQAQEQMLQQQVQQAQQQLMEPQADDVLLDEMLMGPGDMPVDNGMGIELEPSPMDVGEVVLGPEDEALRTLFANQETQDAEEAQQAQQGGQQKQAGMTRTASTRTVGTRPTQGVSRVGGGAAAPARDASVDKLSNLWQSAPDVSEAFGMKR